MDSLEKIGSQLSQLTMYDIKSYYNQAKNMVLNVSEMEAKVREATNDDPWGASSTLMLEIAQATFNFQLFNEIMPCIYSRFMEKEASQWRQIYKALQLLEYIIKHGSERVVDDARSHMSTIKMLRNFHYIDDKGKDQGINVRNRSRELADLLSDLDKIRQERRKAKANRSKYTGTGNDGMSFSSGSGGRYGGFGSDSMSGGGGYEGGSSGYGGGGSSSYGRDYSGGGDSYSGRGGSSGGFRDSSARKDYDEYDAGDDDEAAPRRSNSISQRPAPATSSRRSTAPAATARQAAPPPPKPVVQEFDLLGGLDEEPISSGPNKALPAVGGGAVASPVDAFDDEFGEFSAAPASPPPAASPAPAAAAGKVNIFEMLNSSPAAAPTPSYTPSHTSTPSYGGQQNMFSTPIMPAAPARPTHSTTSSFSAMAPKPTSPPSGAKSPATVGFDDLWSMSLGSSKPATPSGAGKSIKDLEKEKALAGIWGSSGGQAAGAGGARAPAMGMGMGSFGSGAPTSSGGGDDLLL